MRQRGQTGPFLNIYKGIPGRQGEEQHIYATAIPKQAINAPTAGTGALTNALHQITPVLLNRGNTIGELAAITQGAAPYQRLGDTLVVKEWRLRLHLERLRHAAATTQTLVNTPVRIVLVAYKSNGVLLEPSIMFQPTSTGATAISDDNSFIRPYSVTATNRCLVLHDHVYRVDQTGGLAITGAGDYVQAGGSRSIEILVRPNLPIRYEPNNTGGNFANCDITLCAYAFMMNAAVDVPNTLYEMSGFSTIKFKP